MAYHIQSTSEDGLRMILRSENREARDLQIIRTSGDGLRMTLTPVTINNSQVTDSKSYNVISRTCGEDGVKMTLKLTENTKATGYRIFDLEKLDEHINILASHAAECGSLQERVREGKDVFHIMKDAKKYGLATILLVQCLGCGGKFYVTTSKKVQTVGTQKRFDINVRAVWGTMVTGHGQGNLDELCGTMDMPSLSRTNFIKLENEIGQLWETRFEDEMLAAGIEEKNLAISEGTYFRGVPAITVVCDGGWSKRSHRHSYNANGGVGVIIGAKTKKVLYMGVRNKYCYICSTAQNQKVDPKDHQCFKNWTASSQAMEADIIVEGFLKAETMHGVRYMYLIADGDSSVYARITEEVPEWGSYVAKVECANHVCKCLRTHLEHLVEDNKEFKGRNNLTKTIRGKIVSVVRSSIAYNHQQMTEKKIPKAEAIKTLKLDILNTAYHLSGDHSKCSSFCHIVQERERISCDGEQEGNNSEDEQTKDDIVEAAETESDFMDPQVLDDQIEFWKQATSVTEIKVPSAPERSNFRPSEELHKHIHILLQRVANKADRLISNETTNLAESWMGIRMKFDGGKVFHRCARGSWNYRCSGSGLRKNMGPDWAPIAWETTIGTEPGNRFRDCYQKRKRHHEISLKNQQKPEAKRRKLRRKFRQATEGETTEARQSYGPEALEVIDDIPAEELKALTEEYLQKEVMISDMEMENITLNTRQQSLCDLWSTERKKRLTASNFGQVITRNPKTKVVKLVKRLLYSTFTGTRLTRKGLRLEKSAKQEYSRNQENKGLSIRIEDAGLCISPQYRFLAASPDGIVHGDPDGPGLIEIKHVLLNNTISFKQAIADKKDFCLRLVDNTLQLKRNHKFYYQLHGQLFICEKNWVDLVVRRVEPYEVHVERIYKDEDFFKNEMQPKLEAFYMKALLPELANPRFGKSPGIREPGIWFTPDKSSTRKSQRGKKKPQLTPTASTSHDPVTSVTTFHGRRKKQKFVGRRISHEWEDECGEKTWYSGHVVSILSGKDGDDTAVYEVYYDHDGEIYEIDHLAEDFASNSIVFLDV